MNQMICVDHRFFAVKDQKTTLIDMVLYCDVCGEKQNFQVVALSELEILEDGTIPISPDDPVFPKVFAVIEKETGWSTCLSCLKRQMKELDRSLNSFALEAVINN